MHLLYADEAGSVEDASQRYFVLAGVSVFERQIYWLTEQLDAIAARFNPGDSISVELHGSPMLNGSKEWRAFRLPERILAMKDALETISRSHHSTRVFGVAVDKDKAARNARSPVEVAFEQMASRFDQYLMRLHRRGDSQRGVMVFDKSKDEISIQALAADYRQIGHTWGKVRNLAEVPLFLDSRTSRLLQLADLTAYALFRNFERSDDQFYKLVAPYFDREGATVHGLHHYN